MAYNTTGIYAYPNSSDTLGIFEIMRYAHNTSDGILFPYIILAVFFIIFIALLLSGKRSAALIGSSLIGLFLSIPLAVMGLFAPKYMYLLAIFLGVGVLWAKLED